MGTARFSHPRNRYRLPRIFIDRAGILKRPIGVFQGQVLTLAGAVVPWTVGSYDPGRQQYTIRFGPATTSGIRAMSSAFLWKKDVRGRFRWRPMSNFPDPKGLWRSQGRCLVIRQNLEDDAKGSDAWAEHGVGMIHLAWRADKGAMMKDCAVSLRGQPLAGVQSQARSESKKHGDADCHPSSACRGEPMHQLGPPITLHFEEPFYVGDWFLLPLAGHTGYCCGFECPPGETRPATCAKTSRPPGQRLRTD